MDTKKLLQKLAEQAYEGKLLLFVGAGFSKCVVGNDIALSWLQLLRKVADKFDITETVSCLNGEQPLDFPQIASNMVKRLSEKRGMTREKADFTIKEHICFLCNWYPDKIQKLDWLKIFQLINPSMIVTTNYDHVLSEILEEKADVIDSSMTLPSTGQSQFVVYHLHGIRTAPERIVLTREDYIEALRPFSYRQVKLATLLRENSVLFIGYGRNDLNVLSAMDMAYETFKDVKTIKPDKLYVQLIYQESCAADLVETNTEHGNETYMLKTPNIMNTLASLARECTDYTDIQQRNFEFMVEQVKQWTIKESNDKTGMQQRRSNIFNLFENNISLLNSQSRLGKKFNAQFDELIKSYYRQVRTTARKRGAFYRYADLWAILHAYFSMIAPFGSRGVLSPNTRRFKYAIGWLNGIAWFMDDGEGKAHMAYDWFCEDWTRFDKRIKETIKSTAQIYSYRNILKLIDRAEAKTNNVDAED